MGGGGGGGEDQSEAHLGIMGWGVETRVRLTWG